MTIGEQIKDLRIKNGVSQEQLAEAVNVSRQTVSSWERGEKFPSKKNIERLAIFFKISENYFYRQEEHCSRSVLTDEDAQKDITPLTEQETAVSSCLLSSTPCPPESEEKSTKKSRKKIIITSVIFAFAALSLFLVFLFDRLRYLEEKRLEEKGITVLERFTISTTDWVPLIIGFISLALIAFCGGLLIRHFIKQKKEKKHEKKK